VILKTKKNLPIWMQCQHIKSWNITPIYATHHVTQQVENRKGKAATTPGEYITVQGVGSGWLVVKALT